MPNLVFRIGFILLLVLSLFLEGSIFIFPFVVLFSILYFIFFEDMLTFFIICVISVFLDAFLLRTLGESAFFLFTFFLLLIVFEKVFMVRFSAVVIAVSTFIGVEAYRQFAGYPFSVGLEALLLVGLIAFIVIEKRVSHKGERVL